MGYIIIKSKDSKKITINNQFSYLFLITEKGLKKLKVESLFSLIQEHGEQTNIEEVKQLTFNKN